MSRVDRKELVAIFVLGSLVLVLATVRLFQAPLPPRPPEKAPGPVRRPDPRAPVAAESPATALAKRVWAFPLERPGYQNPNARALFEAAECVFAEGFPDAVARILAEGGAEKTPGPATSLPLYDAASAIYTYLRAQYPGEPTAEAALLRIAQCYQLTRRYAEAARAYERFLETYPGSELRPVALLWSGDTHLRIAEREVARKRLEEILTRYGDSLFVDGAKLRLASLEPKAKP